MIINTFNLCLSMIQKDSEVENCEIKLKNKCWMDAQKKKRKHTQTLNPNKYMSLLVFVFSLHPRVFSPK